MFITDFHKLKFAYFSFEELKEPNSFNSAINDNNSLLSDESENDVEIGNVSGVNAPQINREGQFCKYYKAF